MERYRTTIILVVVLAVLAGVAFFLNKNGTSSAVDVAATPTVDASKLVWQESEPVDSLDILSGTQQVSLRKDLSTTVWSLIAPIKADADPYTVGSEADSLQNLQALAVLTSATNLAQYNLDKPAMQVIVKSNGAKPTKHTLYIGSTTVDGAGYYVKEPDNPKVYIVSNVTIEPMKTWLVTPPQAQPSPTPIPLTVAPANTITPTQS